MKSRGARVTWSRALALVVPSYTLSMPCALTISTLPVMSAVVAAVLLTV